MTRLVKRYGNRKLYDTSDSRYVTLDEIGRWVKAGEDVKILENDTGEDLTAVTFAQIILEEERKKTGLLSLGLLRQLIQHGESALHNIAATVDRGMEVIRAAPDRARDRVQELGNVADRLGALQTEVVRRSVEMVTSVPAVQKELARVERTLRALEARIARLTGRPDGESETPPSPTGTS